MTKITILTAASISLTLLATSNSFATSRQAIISGLLQQTGVTQQVESLQNLVVESSDSNAIRCNSEPAPRTIPGYNPDSIIFDITSELSRDQSMPLASVEDWYRSELGDKIRAAEKTSIDFELFSNFIHTDRFKDATRTSLIQSIVKHTRTSEFVATIGTEIEYAGIVHSGCITKAASTGSANREKILADVTRNDKTLTAILLQADIMAETAYLLRTLTAAELREYAQFTSSVEARLFYTKLIDAIHHSLTQAGNRVSFTNNSKQYSLLEF